MYTFFQIIAFASIILLMILVGGWIISTSGMNKHGLGKYMYEHGLSVIAIDAVVATVSMILIKFVLVP